MPHLEDYDLKIVERPGDAGEPLPVHGRGAQEAARPEDQGVLPRQSGQPERRRARARRRSRRSAPILKKRPDLILLTDDVYGTFVPGFRSLLGAFPHNTIGVYSYSKYFGCTGWRLGVDRGARGQHLRQDDRQASRSRSRRSSTSATAALTLEPRKIAFIDRIVADSRDVALNHTAGPVAAAAGDDDAVLARRADGREEGLPEGLHRHRQEARRGDDRGAGHRGRAERALRLLLRPDRLRVLGAQVPRRGRRRSG